MGWYRRCQQCDTATVPEDTSANSPVTSTPINMVKPDLCPRHPMIVGEGSSEDRLPQSFPLAEGSLPGDSVAYSLPALPVPCKALVRKEPRQTVTSAVCSVYLLYHIIL